MIKGKLEDLSYSNLVNILQGNKNKAAEFLNDFAKEYEDLDSNIRIKTQQLKDLENRKLNLHKASKNIATHMNRDLPLFVTIEKTVIILTEKTIEIVTNVI
jgi:hypothetical protein